GLAARHQGPSPTRWQASPARHGVVGTGDLGVPAGPTATAAAPRHAARVAPVRCLGALRGRPSRGPCPELLLRSCPAVTPVPRHGWALHGSTCPTTYGSVSGSSTAASAPAEISASVSHRERPCSTTNPSSTRW